MKIPSLSEVLTVLLIGSDSSERLCRRGQLHGFEVIELDDPSAISAAVVSKHIDLIVVCDPILPEVYLRAVERCPPIVWIAESHRPGLADVLLFPATSEEELRECVRLVGTRTRMLSELERVTQQLQQAFVRGQWRGKGRWHGPRELMTMAMTDPLTGIFSRRYFDDSICQEFEHAQAVSRPLSLLLIDLDQFKPVNDTHGHHVGDAVLIEVASRLRRCTRSSDIVCRYGGDEFAVIAPGTTASSAARIGGRVLAGVSGSPYAIEHKSIQIGCSLGIATVSQANIETSADLILCADCALMDSKRAGGNQVCVAG